MTKLTRRLLPLAALLALSGAHAADTETIAAELDALWSGISRAASAGDFEAMAAAYHPDAVLVSEARGRSMPITVALEKWRPGIEATRNGEMSAGVEFRFTGLLHDDMTAHQVGIFRYEERGPGEEATVVFIHFEALLLKRGEWKMLMEYQKSEATEAEWAAAGR